VQLTLWLGIGVALALVLALWAWMRARHLASRLERLTKQFWDLRYEHGELRARVARLDPHAPADPVEPPEPPAQTFIPLSSLKR
jgi:hypothetical protein